MRLMTITLTALALAGCNKADTTAATNDANVAMAEANTAMTANDTAPAAAGEALASINSTTWEYTDAKTGKPMQESIDASGNYITVSGKEHIDHGTAVMKDGKACFTSAMNKDGEMCWSDPKIAIGGSGETVSDKGEKLPIKRTEYVALTM
jgi:hypothetical protein